MKRKNACIVCGCTRNKPCITPEGPCGWVEEGRLCSQCVVKIPAGKNYFADQGKLYGLIVPKMCQYCAHMVRTPEEGFLKTIMSAMQIE